MSCSYRHLMATAAANANGPQVSTLFAQLLPRSKPAPFYTLEAMTQCCFTLQANPAGSMSRLQYELSTVDFQRL